MLDVLKEIEEFDTIFFVPHSEDENQVRVEVGQYKDRGEKIGGSDVGDNYDIILFKLDEEDYLVNLDRFDAILIEPREYISRLIKDDWYGMVTRKTTTSKELSDGIFAKWTNLCYNPS